MLFQIEICRVSEKMASIEVEADTYGEASEKALEEASNTDFSHAKDGDVRYRVADILEVPHPNGCDCITCVYPYG